MSAAQRLTTLTWVCCPLRSPFRLSGQKKYLIMKRAQHNAIVVKRQQIKHFQLSVPNSQCVRRSLLAVVSQQEICKQITDMSACTGEYHAERQLQNANTMNAYYKKMQIMCNLKCHDYHFKNCTSESSLCRGSFYLLAKFLMKLTLTSSS